MARVTYSGFSVGGKAQLPLAPPVHGSWLLPCDGTTALEIECSVKCTRLQGDPSPVNVDVWVGSYTLFPFLSTDLIEDRMVFNGPVGQTDEITFTYRVVCKRERSGTCSITPSVVAGGAATRLHPDGSSMQLTFAYLDPKDGLWYHTPFPIGVICDRDRTTKRWRPEQLRLARLDTGEARQFLAGAEREGYLQLTEKGRNYLASHVELDMNQRRQFS